MPSPPVHWILWIWIFCSTPDIASVPWSTFNIDQIRFAYLPPGPNLFPDNFQITVNLQIVKKKMQSHMGGINSLKMKLNTLERSRFISCLWFDLFHWRQINFWALTWCCGITAEKKIDWTLVPCTALMLYFDTVCSKLYNTLVLLFNGSSVRYTAVL